jgi:hypothetical protein
VGKGAGDPADQVPGQLPGTGNETDRRSGGTEHGEIGAVDRTGALVGQVGKQAQHTDEHHEPHPMR